MPHPNGASLDPEWVRTGATLRAIREALGVPQWELAQKSAVGRTTLVRIESGTRRLTPTNAIAVARVLGVRPIALLNPTAFADEVDARIDAVTTPAAAAAEAPAAVSS